MAKRLNDFKQAVRELVEFQAERRSTPKEQRLLDLLSGDTSSAPAGGSTSHASPIPTQNDEQLITQIMAKGSMSREEAIAQLEAVGAL